MDFNKFKILLDENYSWPAEYTYRFVIPFTELSELERILAKEEVTVKPSQNGKYLSVVVKMEMNNSEEVISIYKKVSNIKGIISL
jgi:putative lipoic acid-binding regulatory protein